MAIPLLNSHFANLWSRLQTGILHPYTSASELRTLANDNGGNSFSISVRGAVRTALASGLVDEYDYIYSLSSKLLHATPASVTSDHKNLEFSEVRIFLKYIDVKMDEIILLAEEYLDE